MLLLLLLQRWRRMLRSRRTKRARSLRCDCRSGLRACAGCSGSRDIEAAADAGLDAAGARRLEEVASSLEVTTPVTRLDLAHMGHAGARGLQS